jgi:hypothetical protein
MRRQHDHQQTADVLAHDVGAALMSVRLRFRCEHCHALPDPATQRTLEGQLRDRTHGEFRDAQPGGWLIWTAGGALGSKLYACPRHRTDLTDQVRRHFGAIRSIVWRSEPYPALWPDGLRGLDERDLAALLAGDRAEAETARTARRVR